MKTQIGDVHYNAADQCFEALITFHLNEGRVRVASQFEAPLTADFEAVSAGLWQNAVAALQRPGAMTARLQAPRVVPPRMTKPDLDPRVLTESLLPRAA